MLQTKLCFTYCRQNIKAINNNKICSKRQPYKALFYLPTTKAICLTLGFPSKVITSSFLQNVPLQKPENVSYCCLKTTDTGAFKQDLSHAGSQTSSNTDYNNHLCSVPDKHVPLCLRTASTRKPTPWFSSIIL